MKKFIFTLTCLLCAGSLHANVSFFDEIEHSRAEIRVEPIIKNRLFMTLNLNGKLINYLLKQDLRPFLINVRPDPIPGRIIVGPVDPKSIKDPQIRDRYLRKIEANESSKLKLIKIITLRSSLQEDLDLILARVQSWDNQIEKQQLEKMAERQKEIIDTLLRLELNFSNSGKVDKIK